MISPQETSTESRSGRAPRAWERRDGLALFVLIFAFYALLGRGTFYTSDEGGIFNTALALIQTGSPALPGPYENVHLGKDGRWYSCRELLPTLATAPFVLAGMIVDRMLGSSAPPLAPLDEEAALYYSATFNTNWPIFLAVTFLGPMITALALLSLHRFIRYEGGTRCAALWLTLLAALATPLPFYARTLFAQVFEAALLMAAFVAARQWRATGNPRYAWRLGLICGLMLMARAALGPVVLCFLAYLLRTSQADRRQRIRAVVHFLLPTLVGGMLVGWYNWQRWGSPFDFGYHHQYERFDTSPWTGMFGLLLSPGKGLLLYAPVLLLPLFFARSLWERGRAEVVLLGTITIFYLAVYGRWYDWYGGLAWGPRFLVPLIAPWLALLARGLRGNREPALRGLLAASFVIGFLIQCPGILVWPHWVTQMEPEPFSLARSHLVQTMQVLGERGPHDLWLASREARSLPSHTILCAGMLALMVGASLVLWLRAGSRAERLATQLLIGGVTMLLLVV